MTLNFKPTKIKELSHFTQTLHCQPPQILNQHIPLKTTDIWQDSTPNLKITSPLCKGLGWETEKEFNTISGWEKPDDTDQWITDKTYWFHNKKQIMYVYAPSLIQDVYVGHTNTQLLNYTVPGLAEVRGDSYFVEFNVLSYVKVKEQLHSLNELLVEIRNELGDLYKFTDVRQRPTDSLKFVKAN